jgi:hypothetical protein
MLNHASSVAILPENIENSWEPITALTVALLERNTVTGAEIYEVLRDG